MKNTRIKLEVVYTVTVDIDESDEIVQEYGDTSELLEHIVGYNFSATLPVIRSGGVKVVTRDAELFKVMEQGPVTVL